MEELATHSKPGDYFIALYGQVIDISNFISKHPGGEKILVANAGKDATQKFESIWIWSCISAPFQSSSILFRSVLHVSTSVSLCIGHPRYPCRLRGLRFGLQMVSGKHRGFAERLEGPSTASAGCEEVPWVSHVVACGGSLCSRSCVRPLRWLPWWQHETDLGLPREKISANLRCF